jgi:ceramide glucosyltransferase
MMEWITGGFAVLSALLGLWQLGVGWRFPLHRRHGRRPAGNQAHGITILKPIKGCDAETDGCLRSWFQQEYPGPRQILMGVASLDDPVVPLARQLIAAYPEAHGQLIVCDQDLGVNAKVSILIQLHTHSRHEFVCVSDADVWAPKDYLTESMVEFQDARVGLVNSFYQNKCVSGLGARWEALAINADFWSQVLQAASLRSLDFALGAAMVFRREAFDRSGGFRALSDLLADDFHLGHHLAQRGLAIHLSPIVVECRSGPATFSSIWLHQLRWARTIRTCRAWPYFFSILSNATLWPLLWWVTVPTQTVPVLSLLLLRAGQAWLLEYRLTRRWDRTSLGMAWIKDGLQLVIWALAFAGSVVSWRGRRYRVDRRGKLTRLTDDDRYAKQPGPKKFAGAA